MVVSMTHPHDPFAIPRGILEPLCGRGDRSAPRHVLPVDEADPHSRRVRPCARRTRRRRAEEQVRAARRAYYGAISYVDDQFGRLRRALQATGLADDTIIVIVVRSRRDARRARPLVQDDLLRGRRPRPARGACARTASRPRGSLRRSRSIDLLPTFLDLDRDAPRCRRRIEGRSLLPHLEGRPGHDEVFAEYLAEGALAPIVMIRRGRYKFIHSPGRSRSAL